MATWKRVSGEPITTESRTRVYSDDGREGYVAISREQRGAWDTHGPRLYGPVVAVESQYNSDGTVVSEKKTVIDAEPTFA